MATKKEIDKFFKARRKQKRIEAYWSPEMSKKRLKLIRLIKEMNHMADLGYLPPITKIMEVEKLRKELKKHDKIKNYDIL